MDWSEFSFMLKPSALGGVGVFATHDIPQGTHLFNQQFNQQFQLRTMKTKDVPAPLVKYCIYLNDEECLCPERFDRMEIGWYINHSSTPNIARKHPLGHATEIRDNKDKERIIFATQDIKAGDEILIDYNGLAEPEHLKEDFYKPK